jgi:hypothetical protein
VENKSEVGRESRRNFLKYLGVSSAGIAITTAAHAAKEKSKKGFEVTREELEKLKDDFEALDRKTKFMLRTILFLTGLDIFF